MIFDNISFKSYASSFCHLHMRIHSIQYILFTFRERKKATTKFLNPKIENQLVCNCHSNWQKVECSCFVLICYGLCWIGCGSEFRNISSTKCIERSYMEIYDLMIWHKVELLLPFFSLVHLLRKRHCKSSFTDNNT